MDIQEIEDFLTDVEINQLESLFSQKKSNSGYVQCIESASDIIAILRQALTRHCQEKYDIVSDQVTFSRHDGDQIVKPHYDVRLSETTHKLAVCVKAPLVGGRTLFYNSLVPLSIGQTTKWKKGKAIIFNLDLLDGGENLEQGEKWLLGCKLRCSK